MLFIGRPKLGVDGNNRNCTYLNIVTIPIANNLFAEVLCDDHNQTPPQLCWVRFIVISCVSMCVSVQEKACPKLVYHSILLMAGPFTLKQGTRKKFVDFQTHRLRFRVNVGDPKF